MGGEGGSLEGVPRWGCLVWSGEEVAGGGGSRDESVEGVAHMCGGGEIWGEEVGEEHLKAPYCRPLQSQGTRARNCRLVQPRQVFRGSFPPSS